MLHNASHFQHAIWTRDGMESQHWSNWTVAHCTYRVPRDTTKVLACSTPLCLGLHDATPSSVQPPTLLQRTSSPQTSCDVACCRNALRSLQVLQYPTAVIHVGRSCVTCSRTSDPRHHGSRADARGKSALGSLVYYARVKCGTLECTRFTRALGR